MPSLTKQLSSDRAAIYEALQDCNGPLTVYDLVDGGELDEVNAAVETMVHDGLCWREGDIVGLVSEAPQAHLTRLLERARLAGDEALYVELQTQLASL